MGIHSVDSTKGKEPHDWKVSHFAAISGSEDFVQQLMVEMPELVDAGKIVEPTRQQVKEAILTISIDGLTGAFEDLKMIRASATQTLPILNKNQLYENLSCHLWVAYDELTQKAAKLIDPDIGFVFSSNDSNFEKGGIAYTKKPSVPAWFVPYLREQRTRWQNDLARFRNFLLHRHATGADYSHHYHPEHAEMIFDAVWRTIADILAALLGMQLYAILLEIPTNERPAVWPRRFRFAVKNLSVPEELSRSFMNLGPGRVTNV
jgi:hypothetical protein